MTDVTGTPTVPRSAAWRSLLLIAVPIVIADQITKVLVRGALGLHDSRTVIPGVLDLTHVRNTGAAFGILNSADFTWKPLLMMLIAAAALLAIGAYAVRLGEHERLARAGLALILGGAIGNLIDRVRHGYVLDFVDVYYGNVHFWAFNVADASITIGALLVLFEVLFAGGRHASAAV
jgi:signal peptidase II